MAGTVLWEGDLLSPLDVEWEAVADDAPPVGRTTFRASSSDVEWESAGE
jgi:hypothetical protein